MTDSIDPGKPQRVFMGLTEVSGYWARLERGMHSLGVDATFVNLEADRHGYERSAQAASRRLPWTVPALRATRRLGRRVAGRSAGLRIASLALESPLRILLLLWALPRFDTFIFGYRSTFLMQLDLPVLRVFRKRVICVFHGSDERPPYMSATIAPGMSGQALARRTRIHHSALRFIERYAHVIVSEPNSGHMWSSRVVIYQVVGNPVRLDRAAQANEGTCEGRIPRVLHAPSHSVAKGTSLIRAAVEDLRREGLQFDYREVTGVTNEALQSEILQADVVVDQAFGDTPFTMFSAEASALGRCVVVGGYGWDHLRRFLSDSFAWPAVCRPEELPATIARLLGDRDERSRTAAECRTFIRSQWDEIEVARRFMRLVEDRIPLEWFFDPADIRYSWGNGMSIEQVSGHVQDLLDTGGPSALRMDHNPACRDHIIADCSRRPG